MRSLPQGVTENIFIASTSLLTSLWFILLSDPGARNPSSQSVTLHILEFQVNGVIPCRLGYVWYPSLPWDSCAGLVCQESILGVPEWYCVLSSLFLLYSETPVQAFDYYDNLYVSAYIVMCIFSWATPRKEAMRSHRRCMFHISRDSNGTVL